MNSLFNFYDKLSAYLSNAELDAPMACKGCTDAEIDQQEQIWGVHFPLAYRLFLKWCGKGTMEWMSGQDFTADSLGYSWECATTLLAETQDVLELETFVISQWQGYNFFTITLGEDNPNVTLHIIKGDDPALLGLNRIEYGRFTDWIIQQIKAMMEFRQGLRRINGDVPAICAELDRIALLATE